MKRKLNKCAHCDCMVTTAVFTIDGHLYFMCYPHWVILQLLIQAEKKVFKKIQQLKAEV